MPVAAVLPAASALGERPARATAARPVRPAPGRRQLTAATHPATVTANRIGAGGPSSSRAAIVSPCKITAQGRGLAATSLRDGASATLALRSSPESVGTYQEDGGRAEQPCHVRATAAG